MDFLNYIKSLFSFNFPEPLKKRRITDDFDDLDLFSSPKFRRIQSPIRREMDDILISPDVIRRPIRNLKSPRNAIPKEIIILDDDYPRNEQRFRKKYTSTPADAGLREDDEIKFVGEYKSSDKKRDFQKNSCRFVKPLSLFHSVLPERRNSCRNISKSLMNGNNNGNRLTQVSSYTTRLDDKKEFQNLLESHLSAENSYNDSSQYFTPNSRLSKYDFSSRGKKILSLSRQNSRNNSGVGPLIDLTHEDQNGSSSSGKLSVRDKIKKVLSSFDDEPVEIPDSESDLEILPRPPTPEPDIKVEPINSFQKIVDTSYVSNQKWLADLVESHRKQIEDRTRDIKHLEESSKKLNEINRDIRIGNLTRQVDRCLQIKEAILPIEVEEPELPQLTPQQYALVDKAFKGNPNEVLVRKFNLNITRKDILTLAGLNWLNDEVINFYMNLIMDRSNTGNGNYPKSYCFNTFFYPKLLKDGPESLRRWTRRVDLFSMDIICIPIHLGVHWCMSIIDFRNKSIKYYDSMGSSNQKCLNALRKYLESEHMDKKKTAYDTSEFTAECVRDIPQQMNGSDCGMFSCTFAEFYSRDAKFTFKQDDMPYLRSKMVVEIITGELLIK
ncbi:sentrin-specific protease-like isoform X2 [Coccinella septempunctata]|nr:sentrin-specific protease-like isoform X2 [Coccinella septempunctata]